MLKAAAAGGCAGCIDLGTELMVAWADVGGGPTQGCPCPGSSHRLPRPLHLASASEDACVISFAIWPHAVPLAHILLQHRLAHVKLERPQSLNLELGE